MELGCHGWKGQIPNLLIRDNKTRNYDVLQVIIINCFLHFDSLPFLQDNLKSTREIEGALGKKQDAQNMPHFIIPFDRVRQHSVNSLIGNSLKKTP